MNEKLCDEILGVLRNHKVTGEDAVAHLGAMMMVVCERMNMDEELLELILMRMKVSYANRDKGIKTDG